MIKGKLTGGVDIRMGITRIGIGIGIGIELALILFLQVTFIATYYYSEHCKLIRVIIVFV